MKQTYRVAFFIIALFLSSHFNSMIVDGLDEEETFTLEIMVVSEGTESNCAMPTDSIILKRDAWNYFCLG